MSILLLRSGGVVWLGAISQYAPKISVQYTRLDLSLEWREQHRIDSV
jgi:hypothetical protein